MVLHSILFILGPHSLSISQTILVQILYVYMLWANSEGICLGWNSLLGRDGRLGRGSQESLWHNRRVVVVDLPFTILPHINEGVTSLYLVSSSTHGELVNASIRSPSFANVDSSINNLALFRKNLVWFSTMGTCWTNYSEIRILSLTLRLLLQESLEVVVDRVKVCAGLIGNGRKKDRALTRKSIELS